MRTDQMRFSPLLLPFVLMGFTAGTATAQTPAVAPAPPEPSAPAQPPTPRQLAAGEQSRVVTGDRTIDAGEVIEDIVVVGGSLRVRGEVSGNAAVIGGDLILETGGIIGGDAIVTGGALLNEGGRVGGEMRTIDAMDAEISRQIQEAVGEATATATVEATREAVESERSDAAASRREGRDRDRDRFFSSPIRRGFAGIISTLALGLVLAGIGSILVFYGRPYLETVSDTVRSSVVRAGATGLAASFLVIPAFVVLVVALAVSIIGIPFLLVAVPLYPLAIFAGGIFGLLAVAHAIGERTAEQSRDGLDFRSRNSYSYLFTGLGMALTPLLAANLLEMTGFLGFIGTLLHIVTWLAIWVACTVGFGAVILSRAGTRRTFVTPVPDPGIDGDDFFSDDMSRTPNV